ncbi:MAG TPA: DUF3617 family protein [Steroidobacteraceae bacterium]|jgi:hypothetical protein
MRISRPVLGAGAAMAVLAIFGAKVIAVADDKPAGEMWHQTMSMEMAGMTMPPRTIDVCVPPGRAQEQLSKPQGPGMGDNCSVQDAKREGNKFTAKFSCAGKQPTQGTIETIVDGDHIKGTITMAVSGQQMTMKTDSQKTGTACTPRAAPGPR